MKVYCKILGFTIRSCGIRNILAEGYDLVGNVTQVASTCPWLPNQSFTENFNYDSTDQLVSANEAQSYQLAVNYGNWGKVMQ